MSEIQRLPPVVTTNPVHPNAKTTTHITNGTTTTKTNITSPVCRNCKTQTTPLWRRDETGQVLCNACGLFLKLHGRPRPISLKTDTIKSRNRIKQPNSAKSSVPNTPELKSKDSTTPVKSSSSAGSQSTPQGVTANPGLSVISSSGKKSPKTQKTKKLNGELTPLLPAAGMNKAASQNGALPHLSQIHTPHIGAGGLHHIHHHLSHQVQPLHYPSSTPAQFAPGLQRITSPLLLSNTSSISNARSSSNSKTPGTGSAFSAAQAAAGALETMSHELGPSASFKAANGSLGIGRKDVSLMKSFSTGLRTDSEPAIKKEFSTPSSALNAAAPTAPKLPSLGSNTSVSSPSFGPQFSLSNDSHSGHGTPENRPTSLPPIVGHNSPGNANHLPHFQNNFGYNKSFEATDGEQHSGNGPSSSGNSSSQGNSGSSGNSGNPGTGGNTGHSSGHGHSHGQNSSTGNSGGSSGPPGDDNPHHEITILKTRISELELVNDLYRTRIMELEAMEQAARLREISMRKRLDEVISLQDGTSSPQQPQHQQASQHHLHHQPIPSHDGFHSSQQPTPASSQPSFGQRYALPPIHQVAADSVKREYDGPDSASKKAKLDN
ncbi:transcriptional regulator Gzf3p [[Candida] railenensis]|uniref:Transcriptional regulator Gzf3p n=1 Tax=[Candida] railenensis TaxID=45579 RepID=A0A9P0W1H1_9ASCO|nr:transcriptional regulator Gzf3p [[Candida] railenensis]